MIDLYKEKLIAEGRLSNRTIVRHLTVLHGIFKRAKRMWGLRDNPASADLVERPKVVYTGEFDTFDRDEIELLAAHADDAQDAAIYKVAAFTGLRQGELLALRWSRRRLRRRPAPRPAQLHRRRREGAEGKAGPVGADDARRDRRAGAAQGARRSSPTTTISSSAARASTWTTTGSASATTRRWSAQACAGFASTICAMPSARRRSRSSTPTRSRATWATSTTRPPSATCTTSRGARTRPSSRRRSGPSPSTNRVPNRAQLRTTQSKNPRLRRA